MNVNCLDTPDVTEKIFLWEIGLGRETLLQKASSFDEIEHIYIEDTPENQQLVSLDTFDLSYDKFYAYNQARPIYTSYGGITREKLGAAKDPTNTYDASFKTDIIDTIKQYEKTEIENNQRFDGYTMLYHTKPLEEVVENTQFKNNAKITIVYKGDLEDESLELNNVVEYNLASGEINGKTAGAEFEKIDAATGNGIEGAVFDLYKKTLLEHLSNIEVI